VTEPIELVPLRCLRCETPVPAQVDEVAWVCKQCGQGLLLDEAQGLAALEVRYVAGVAPDTKGRPYWVVDGQVSLERDTYGTWGKKNREADRFWGEPKRFFVPAFSSPLDTLLELGTNLLIHPPDLKEDTSVPFESVTLAPGDLPAIVEFIVLAIEAERKDKLKTIQVSLKLETPVLWVLPD